MDVVIEFRDVVAGYGSHKVLDGLTLSVPGQGVVGIVGPDGAGKTTFARVCLGLVVPWDGSVSVLGLEPGDGRLKERVGYLPQQLQVLGHLTVAENLEYFAALSELPRRKAAERSEALLQATGLAQFRTRLAERLSGGMRQKLALSCAIIHEPELVLLDEPSTGLDPISRRDMWELIYELVGRGCSVVVATPSFEEAARCQFVCLMEGGRLQAAGRPDELVEAARGRVVEAEADDELLKALEQAEGVLAVRQVGQVLRAVAEPDTAEQLVSRHGCRMVEPTLEEAAIVLRERRDGGSHSH